MSQPTQSLNIREFMTRHLLDVFETMVSEKAVPSDARGWSAQGEHVSGSVGFGGENVTGAVYLHLSTPFATRIAASMLGLSAGEMAGETEVNDVVGEVTNMLTGGLKSALCDAGAPCAVSTPTIIRGTSFVVEPIADVEQMLLGFQCGDERVMVEVHIRYS
jgi:chemotaxis protein CheX